MPTLGWVLEGDIERFLTGTTQIDGIRTTHVPSHACPFCYARFEHARPLLSLVPRRLSRWRPRGYTHATGCPPRARNETLPYYCWKVRTQARGTEILQ